MPAELFLKFRKEIQGFRVGVNLEFCFISTMLQPMISKQSLWKFAYEPIYQDVRLLSKKIPLTKFLNIQLTTCLGGDGVSRIRNKTTLGLVPGLDFRFGWRADYVLPEITGQKTLFLSMGSASLLLKFKANHVYFDKQFYLTKEKISNFWIPRFKLETIKELGHNPPFTANGFLFYFHVKCLIEMRMLFLLRKQIKDRISSGRSLCLQNIFQKSSTKVNEGGADAEA
ncbi:hypothetical protein QQP08_025636 [Theobroma cacao]|nr:hypothetical protein QQP08_025636 [Theobroma cacao]